MISILTRVALLLSLTVSLAQAQSAAQRLTGSQRDIYARLLAMADTRTVDTLAINLALASTSTPLAAFAALSVGQLGRADGAAFIPRLRGLLTDPRDDVAANAAYALGLLRDTASTGALTAALGAGDRRPLEAAWALGQIGEPARAAIVRALSDHRFPPPVRVQLLLAAAKLRPVPAAAIATHLAGSDRYILWAASYALTRQRVAAGVRALLALAENPAVHSVAPDVRPATGYYGRTRVSPDRIRAEIARGVARPASGDSLGDAAFALLARLARDPHPHVRINALRSLATFESRGVALLDSGTVDRDPNVRLAALQAIAATSGLTFDWPALWGRDTSFTYRRYVAEAAAAQGVRLPQLDGWRAHRDWRYRAAVTSAIASARDTAMRGYVLPLATDPDARVRAAALGVLAADTSALSESLRTLVRRGISDPDPGVRATAISALGRRPHPDDIPLVIATLAGSERDTDSDARVAAISYLAAAWRRDSSAFQEQYRLVLSRTPPPADPVARRAAAAFPLLAHWGNVRIEPRPRSWYRSAVDRYVVPALAGRPPVAIIRTQRGPITLELYGADAPLTVRNLSALARRGYYNGSVFHRVVPNFVVQDGDPTGSGSGGPGYSIRDEFNPRRYERGVLGMALSGPDTGGSQWFVTHSPQPHLDGGYTVFGRVTDGYAALDAVVQGDRIVRIDIR